MTYQGEFLFVPSKLLNTPPPTVIKKKFSKLPSFFLSTPSSPSRKHLFSGIIPFLLPSTAPSLPSPLPFLAPFTHFSASALFRRPFSSLALILFGLSAPFLSAPFSQTGPNEGPMFGPVWPNGGPCSAHGPPFGQTGPNRGPPFGPARSNDAERERGAGGWRGPVLESWGASGGAEDGKEMGLCVGGEALLGREGDESGARRREGDGSVGVERKEEG